MTTAGSGPAIFQRIEVIQDLLIGLTDLGGSQPGVFYGCRLFRGGLWLGQFGDLRRNGRTRMGLRNLRT